MCLYVYVDAVLPFQCIGSPQPSCLAKVSTMVSPLGGAIRCHILRQKCTNFDFSCGFVPDPVGGRGAHCALKDHQAGFHEFYFEQMVKKGKQGKRKERKEGEGRKERGGKECSFAGPSGKLDPGCITESIECRQWEIFGINAVTELVSPLDWTIDYWLHDASAAATTVVAADVMWQTGKGLNACHDCCTADALNSLLISEHTTSRYVTSWCTVSDYLMWCITSQWFWASHTLQWKDNFLSYLYAVGLMTRRYF